MSLGNHSNSNYDSGTYTYTAEDARTYREIRGVNVRPTPGDIRATTRLQYRTDSVLLVLLFYYSIVVENMYIQIAKYTLMNNSITDFGSKDMSL